MTDHHAKRCQWKYVLRFYFTVYISERGGKYVLIWERRPIPGTRREASLDPDPANSCE